METRAERVAAFIRDQFPRSGLEGLLGSRDAEKQRYLESSGASEELVSRAVDGLHDALDGKTPTQKQLEGLEAIILKDECPTLEVANDDFIPPKGRWARLKDDRAWLKDVIPKAGRVDCEALSDPYVGSGLLVAPNLVMTNRHVAMAFADGVGAGTAITRRHAAEVDFKRERSAPTARAPVQVEEVLLIHPYWDIAILKVQNPDKRPHLELSAAPLAGLSNAPVVVIGYPYFRFVGSEYERSVLLDNFGDTPGFKRLQPGRLTKRIDYTDPNARWPKVLALGHNASTLGGNSGSLVVSLNTKAVVGVHFAGEAFVTNWAVPTWEIFRDARVRDLGVRFAGDGDTKPDPEVERAWASLAGKRSVVNGRRPLPEGSGAALSSAAASAALDGASEAGATATLRLTVPVEVTVRVLAPRVDGAPAPGGAGVALERIDLDPDYGARGGYDEDHLDVTVPLPTLTDKAMALVSRDQTRPGDDDSHVLRYHHFSLVMNRSRRLAFFTACNTTRDEALFGGASRKELSAKDTWAVDPRIPAEHQITTEEFYGPSPFDRGHIVQREDAYWGLTKREREWGNFDTFHYTNCSPQDSGYNQRGIWRKLEAQAGDEARAKGLRLSCFAGPVLRRNDPVLWGVRVPRDFWKVVLSVDDETDELRAFGFLLSQAREVARVRDEAVFDPGALSGYLVPIARIEELTEVRFPEVVLRADVRRGQPEEAVDLGDDA